MLILCVLLCVYRVAVGQPEGQIACTVHVADGDNDIRLIDAATGVAHEFPLEMGIENAPQFSRDGRWLVFSGGPSSLSNIYVARPGGSDIRAVTSGAGNFVEPDFSPDGSEVVFHSVYGSIRRVSTAGGAIVDTGVFGAHTRWNPAPGSRLVLSSDYPGSNLLSALDIDTLTNSPRVTNAVRADWSWDGTRIVYVHPGPDGLADLFVCDATGAGSTNITNSPGIADGIGAFSPDGLYVCFSRPTPGPNDPSDLYTMRVDGTELRNLTNTPSIDEVGPTWAPYPTCNPDFNGDGNVDQDDVAALIDVIAGGECP